MELIVKRGEHPADINLPAKERMSDEEFFRFATQHPNQKIERDKNGNILIMPPVNMESGRLEARAITALANWNEATQLGEVFSSNAAFTLANNAVRSADAAWISKERYYALPEDEREKFSHICPDFVIEVRPKSDSVREAEEKMREYIENGVRLGFLIDPIDGTAAVYRADGSVEDIDDLSGVLSGEAVLPGFLLPLNKFRK